MEKVRAKRILLIRFPDGNVTDTNWFEKYMTFFFIEFDLYDGSEQ